MQLVGTLHTQKVIVVVVSLPRIRRTAMRLVRLVQHERQRLKILYIVYSGAFLAFCELSSHFASIWFCL